MSVMTKALSARPLETNSTAHLLLEKKSRLSDQYNDANGSADYIGNDEISGTTLIFRTVAACP